VFKLLDLSLGILCPVLCILELLFQIPHLVSQRLFSGSCLGWEEKEAEKVTRSFNSEESLLYMYLAETV